MEFENPPPTGNVLFDTWAQRLVEMLRTQPSFLVILSAEQSNIALGTWVTVAFETAIYDLGNDFASNTFKAPVDGKYDLKTYIRANWIDTGATYVQIRINTSNRNYEPCIMDPNLSSDPAYWPLNVAVDADMEAGDEAKVEIFQSGGVQQLDISDASFFCGHLIK